MNSLKGSSRPVLTEIKFGCCLITAIAWLCTVAGCTSHSCYCVVPACWVTDSQLQARGGGTRRSGVSRLRRWAYAEAHTYGAFRRQGASVSRQHASSNTIATCPQHLHATPDDCGSAWQRRLRHPSRNGTKVNELEVGSPDCTPYKGALPAPCCCTVTPRGARDAFSRHVAREQPLAYRAFDPVCAVGMQVGCSPPTCTYPRAPHPTSTILVHYPQTAFHLHGIARLLSTPYYSVDPNAACTPEHKPQRCMQFSAAHPHPHQIVPATTLQP